MARFAHAVHHKLSLAQIWSLGQWRMWCCMLQVLVWTPFNTVHFLGRHYESLFNPKNKKQKSTTRHTRTTGAPCNAILHQKPATMFMNWIFVNGTRQIQFIIWFVQLSCWCTGTLMNQSSTAHNYWASTILVYPSTEEEQLKSLSMSGWTYTAHHLGTALTPFKKFLITHIVLWIMYKYPRPKKD